MQTTILWISTLFFFSAIQLCFEQSKSIEAKRYLNPPPEQIEHFTFGFDSSVADSLWLRWIQDSDTCQTYNQSGIEAHAAVEVEPRWKEIRHKNCDNSWAFKMLDGITKVDPKFEMPYLAGAISLSVLTEDYSGATEIFERGLRVYPEDWRLSFRAAYHYIFNVQDKKRAAELLVSAQKYGAPAWLNMLAARLYSEVGEAEIGIMVLENFKRGLTDDSQILAVEKRIAELKAKTQP